MSYRQAGKRVRNLGLTAVLTVSILMGLACKDKGDSSPASGSTEEAPIASSAPETPTPTAHGKAENTTPVESKPLDAPEPVQPKPLKSPPKTSVDTSGHGVAAEEQSDLAKACKAAGLPDPPELSEYSPDLAAVVSRAIRVATSGRGEDIGRLGMLYHALVRTRKDSDRAIACYELARSRQPESFKWPYMLGRVFYDRSSLVRSRTEFESALKLNPEYGRIYAWLGDLDRRQLAGDQAKANFQKYQEFFPDDVDGLIGIAAAELADNNLPASLEMLEKARAVAPDRKSLHQMLSAYYTQAGDDVSARREMAISESLPYRSTEIRFDSLELELWRSLGASQLAIAKVREYVNSGDSDSAIRLGDALLADNPDSALVLSGLTVFYLTIDDAEKALSLAKRAIEADESSASAWAVLSSCYLKQERFEEAVKAADQAIALDPEQPTGYAARSQALLRLERLEDAQASLEKAAEIQPKNPVLRMRIGEILHSQGKLAEARDQYNRALEIARSFPQFPTNLLPLFVTVAGVEMELGAKEDAIKHLEAALDISPSSEFLFARLADIMVEEGRGQEAIRRCQSLITQNPGVPDYAIRLGDLLARAGKSDAAIAHLRKVKQRLPNNPGPSYVVASIFWREKRMEESKAELQKLIETHSDYEPAYGLLARILMDEKDWPKAIELLRAGLQQIPNSAVMNNSLAWILSTSPDASLRKPEEAVALADKACKLSNETNPNYLDTLACAYAAGGNFNDAIVAEQEAIKQAERARKQVSDIEQYTSRLQLFRDGKGYVDKP